VGGFSLQFSACTVCNQQHLAKNSIVLSSPAGMGPPQCLHRSYSFGAFHHWPLAVPVSGFFLAKTDTPLQDGTRFFFPHSSGRIFFGFFSPLSPPAAESSYPAPVERHTDRARTERRRLHLRISSFIRLPSPLPICCRSFPPFSTISSQYRLQTAPQPAKQLAASPPPSSPFSLRCCFALIRRRHFVFAPSSFFAVFHSGRKGRLLWRAEDEDFFSLPLLLFPGAAAGRASVRSSRCFSLCRLSELLTGLLT